MNNRPALHASRIFSWPAERDHHKQDVPARPGPNVRVSPLIQPQGTSTEIELRDCATCAVRSECRWDKFALEICEMQTGKRKYARSGEYTARGMRRRTDRETILEAIRQRRTFCMQDLYYATGIHHSTLRGHLSHLVAGGMIRHVGREGKALIYELVEDA